MECLWISCTVPGNKKDNRIPEGKAELGLGIHGEPGIEQVDFSGAKNAMTIVAGRLAKIIDDGPHVALVNNLGSATPLEMSVIVDELLKSQIGGQIQLVIGNPSNDFTGYARLFNFTFTYF